MLTALPTSPLQVKPGDFDRAIAALSVTPRRRSSAFDSVTAPVTGPDVQTVTFQYGVQQVPVLISVCHLVLRLPKHCIFLRS